MRRILVLAGLLGAGLAAPSAVASPTANHPATVRVIVAPVDSTGHAAVGFTVHSARSGFAVDCSYPEASAGALSPNIEACSPSAAYAIACWKAAAAHRVLCVQDPSSHKVVRMMLHGHFAATGVAPVRDRAPLLMVLTDGTRCQIRDGGAWGQLKGHPNYYGTYSCTRHGVVWERSVGNNTQAHLGIDESRASWTVRTSEGAKPLVTRHVARAYFVATATS